MTEVCKYLNTFAITDIVEHKLESIPTYVFKRLSLRCIVCKETVARCIVKLFTVADSVAF